MSRPLKTVDGTDARVVLEALRSALDGGPAVFPVAEASRGTTPSTAVPDEVALVVQTSGSTAAPKRVMLSASALNASAAASAAALGGSGQWLLALPAHYIAGLNVLTRSIAAGTEPVLYGAGHFDAQRFAAVAEGMTGVRRHTSLVPAQLTRVLDAAEADAAVLAVARRFDRILVGGQATPPALVERAADLGIRLTRTYGSSETGGGCVYDGVPIGDTRIAIVDGQVRLGGSVLAEGYLDDPGRSTAAFVEVDGIRWYRTGDLGELLPDGRLRVTGRADHVIISGGEKVSLDALEAVVRGLGAADAVAVGVPHSDWGEAPVVVTTAAVDSEAVRRAVAERLGVAARPASVLVIDELPTLASSKPDRLAIAELARLAAERLG